MITIEGIYPEYVSVYDKNTGLTESITTNVTVDYKFGDACFSWKGNIVMDLDSNGSMPSIKKIEEMIREEVQKQVDKAISTERTYGSNM